MFLEAADSSYQRSLEVFLEDKEAKRGLRTDWKEVQNVVSLLTKTQKRRDKMLVSSTATHVENM